MFGRKDKVDCGEAGEDGQATVELGNIEQAGGL